MHWRPGQAPRKHSILLLFIRTAAAFVLFGALATLIVSLIRSDGIYQEGYESASHVAHGTEELQTLASLDFRLILDTLDGPNADKAPEKTPRPLTRSSLAGYTVVQHPKSRASLYDTEDFRKQLNSSLSEAQGRVGRLRSSLEYPLGDPPLQNILCDPFSREVKTIALVGNGPLSYSDRTSIESRDIVIRFNLMNNWQRFRERVDIWIMRHSVEASAGYWGINNINSTEAFRVLSSLKAHADALLAAHPVMGAHKPVLMPEAPMNKAFAEDLLNVPSSYPSTGFVGVQAALYCTPPTVHLHIYGFNWSPKTWSGHDMEAERAYVGELQRRGRASVHATACSGMRECGQGDIDLSCHWSTEGRYLCLRGKPRRWRDMTAQVAGERLQDFRWNDRHRKANA